MVRKKDIKKEHIKRGIRNKDIRRKEHILKEHIKKYKSHSFSDESFKSKDSLNNQGVPYSSNLDHRLNPGLLLVVLLVSISLIFVSSLFFLTDETKPEMVNLDENIYDFGYLLQSYAKSSIESHDSSGLPYVDIPATDFIVPEGVSEIYSNEGYEIVFKTFDGDYLTYNSDFPFYGYLNATEGVSDLHFESRNGKVVFCSEPPCGCGDLPERKHCFDGDVYLFSGCGNKEYLVDVCDSSDEKWGSWRCINETAKGREGVYYSRGCSGAECYEDQEELYEKEIASSNYYCVNGSFELDESILREMDFILETEVEGNGSIQPSEGFHTYSYGEVVDLSIEEEEGWEFAGYEGACSGFDCQVNMTENKSVKALFTIKEYNLEINILGDGFEKELGEGIHSISYGSTLSLVAESSNDSYFEGWSGFKESDNEEINFKMPAKDIVLDATFSSEEPTPTIGGGGGGRSSPSADEEEDEEFTLTTATDGEGAIKPEEGEHTYTEGDVVEITAESSEGWEFINFTGDCSGLSCNVTMDTDKSVTAVFEKKDYELELNYVGEGFAQGYDEGIHNITYNETISLNASASEGWQFINWTGYINSSEENITLTMPSDNVSMTAEFGELGVNVIAPSSFVLNEPGNYTYNFTVENPSSFTDTYSLNLSSEDMSGWLINAEDIPSNITLDSKGSENITINLSIPSSATEEDSLKLNLSAFSHTYYGVNDSDAFNVTIEHTPDFSVDITSLGSPVVEGNVFEVIVNVTNNAYFNCSTILKVYPLVDDNSSAEIHLAPRETIENSFDFDTQVGHGGSTYTITANETKTGAESTQELEVDFTTFNLTIEKYGEGTTIPSPGTHILNRTDVVELNSTPASGWEFISWSGDTSKIDNLTSNSTEIFINDTYNISANFERKNWTVTFEDYNGTVLDEQNVTHGSNATEPAEPEREGYTFTGWDDDFTNITKDLTLKAEYEINTYKLTLNVSGEGSVDGYDEGIHNITYNETVYLNASASEGWQFINWTGYINSSEENITLTMPSDNVSMTANFEKLPSVSIVRLTPQEDSVNVTQNEYFNVGVNVTCHYNDCGDVNVSFDPFPAESTDEDESEDTGIWSSIVSFFSNSINSITGMMVQPMGDEPESKAGLISDDIGVEPFYTNETNPRTIEGMNKNESMIVTAWINATGEENSTHTFFEFANITSHMDISDITDEYNVTIESQEN